MLNIDRVWARQAKRFPGQNLSGWRLQDVTGSFNVAGNASSQGNVINFGLNAIIVGIDAVAAPTGQTALQQYRPGRDLYTLTITYQADNRVIVGTAEAFGSSVFGTQGDQFPAMEIVMPQNSALIYNFTNQTSTAITVTVTHQCLMPGNVA